jgi:hypothetical protein
VAQGQYEVEQVYVRNAVRGPEVFKVGGEPYYQWEMLDAVSGDVVLMYAAPANGGGM